MVKKTPIIFLAILLLGGFTIVWPAVQLRLRGGLPEYDAQRRTTVTVLAQDDEYTLNVVCDGQAQDVLIDGLDDKQAFGVQQAGTSSNMSMINGVTNHSVTYNYNIQPRKLGTYTLGPASVVVDGHSDQSDEVVVRVVDSETYDKLAGQTSSRQTLRCKLQLDTTTAVVGQEALVTVVVEDDGQVQERSLQSPSFGKLSFAAVGQPQSQQQLVNGQLHTHITQQYRISADKPGVYTVGPAVAHFIIPDEHGGDPFGAFFGGGMRSLFGGGKKRSVRSNSVQLSVTALPITDETVDGVGRFTQLIVQPDKKVVELNEPFTIKMTVVGQGNFDAMLAPALQVPDEMTVYDSTATTGEGQKTFEYVVQIGHAGTYTMPAQTFSYYDTASQRYKKITSKPASIRVKEAKVATVSAPDPQKAARKKEPEEEEFVIDESAEVPPLAWYWFILLLLLPLVYVLRSNLQRFFFGMSERLGLTSQDKRDSVRLKQLMAKQQVAQLHGFFTTVLARIWRCDAGMIDGAFAEQQARGWGWDLKKAENFGLFIEGCGQAAFAANLMPEADKTAVLEKARYWHTLIVQEGKR